MRVFCGNGFQSEAELYKHQSEHCPQRVNSRGPRVTMRVYKISEKGGKINNKSRTEKPGKRECFLEKTPRFSK